MVQIPQRSTIDQIKEKIEEAQERQQRDYIGGSLIGDECERKIWYDYNGYHKKDMGWKVLCAIEDGHATEDVMADRYRMLPNIELHTHDKDGKQFGFDNGIMKGHYDGVIRGLVEAPKTWHIWEVKTKEEKFLKELQKCIKDYGEKDALKNWDYQYYCQAVIYMHAEGFTRHCMTVAKAGGRDFMQIRTDANPQLAEALLQKAVRIKNAKNPPERTWGKTFYKCKWCDFYEECHGEG